MPEDLAIPITGLFDCLECPIVCTPQKHKYGAAVFHTIEYVLAIAIQSQVGKVICLTCRPSLQCAFLPALVTPVICLELQISMKDGRKVQSASIARTCTVFVCRHPHCVVS